VISAPAGSGKTTLLGQLEVEFAAKGVTGMRPVTARRDEGFDSLSRRIVDALQAAGATVEAHDIAGDDVGPLERGEHFAIALIRALESFASPVALILDDAHWLADAASQQALQTLFEFGPENARVVVSSIRPMGINLWRTRDQGALLEIGFDELCFSVEETTAVAAELGVSMQERDVAAVIRDSGGWAHGVVYLAGALAKQKGRQKRTDIALADAKFDDFMDRQLLSGLNGNATRLLIAWAVPDQFIPWMFRRLPYGTAQEALLAELGESRLFLQPGGGGKTWYQIRPLLRKKLRERFETWSEAERRAVHIACWQMWDEQNLPHEAVRHIAAAGQVDLAWSLAEEIAGKLFSAGDVATLEHLVHQVGPGPEGMRPGMHMWLAWVQLRDGQLDACAGTIALIDGNGLAGAARFRLALLKGMLAVQRDDVTSAMLQLPELVNVPDDVDQISLAGRQNFLTWLHICENRFEEGRLLQAEVHPAIGGRPLVGTVFGTLAGKCLVALSHLAEGNMHIAERICRQVLDEARRSGPECVEALCWSAGLLAEILYELNDLRGVIALLGDKLDLVERVSLPDTVARAFIMFSRAQSVMGSPADALATAKRLEAFGAERGMPRLRAFGLYEQVVLHLQAGESSAAMQALERLETLAEQRARGDRYLAQGTGRLALRARIATQLFLGDLEKAQGTIAGLKNIVGSHRVRRIAVLKVQLAVIAFIGEDHPKASANLVEALQLGRRLGLVRSLLDAHPRVAELVEHALAHAWLGELEAFHAQRLQDSARPYLAHPSAVADRQRLGDQLTGRELEIARLLQLAMPNKKIARLLHLSPETIKWYLKRIYARLGVSSRDEAVARLRQD